MIDAQGTRAPITTLYVLCGLQEGVRLYFPYKLWVTVMDMGYPLHLIDLLAELYRKQLAKVKVAGTLSEWFLVKKGVRQGCVLSLYMKAGYSERMKKHVLTPLR